MCAIPLVPSATVFLDEIAVCRHCRYGPADPDRGDTFNMLPTWDELYDYIEDEELAHHFSTRFHLVFYTPNWGVPLSLYALEALPGARKIFKSPRP